MRVGEHVRSRRSRTPSCSGVTSTKLQLSGIRWAVLPACLLAATATGLACQAGAAQSHPNQTGPAQTRSTQTQSGSAQFPASAALQLHVSGNRLVNANGDRVVLHGVDYSGTEYECVQGNGIFAGPNDKASILAMKTWHVNAVRLPLNEACWNGESYVNPAYAGQDYRAAIENYVKLLNANGLVAVLDLHWTDGMDTGAATDCGSDQAVCQKVMPDAAES